MKIKHERLFRLFYRPGVLNDGPQEWTLNHLGRQQFHEHESRGIIPTDPDPYYWVLHHGKKAFDLHVATLREDFCNPARMCWPGVYALWLDWKGNRWVLPHILPFLDLPEWITRENVEWLDT